METHGPVSAAEASAALASVRGSRARVAWTGYPAWYWLGIAAVLATLPLATLVPDWLGLTITAAVSVLGVVLTVTVSRARGVCEGWTRSAMRPWEGVVLYLPAFVVVLAGAFGARLTWWLSVGAAVLGFALFTGTAFTLSARAARR